MIDTAILDQAVRQFIVARSWTGLSADERPRRLDRMPITVRHIICEYHRILAQKLADTILRPRINN